MSLPAADELFRNTGGAAVQPSTPQLGGPEPEPAAEREPTREDAAPGVEPGAGGRAAPRTPRQTRASAPGTRSGPPQPGTAVARQGGAGQTRRARTPRRPSGRERHDEKITVYVSAEELMDLEHARLVLRGEHGLAVDRGRIVREAVAVVLADLESRGEASILVRRLRGS
ncbi:hypothetical protein [Streptomyces alkaliterrae]|uniref:Cobyrinic acid a,c-diamide synthase n=2 Tax=Streptomyces alkaliterrae TaxID=2213162 RepID=A0A7W3ZTK6_9ACTN|nr:hypothetical protein [Streptomyces alkaliterrae]MBB1260364.1 hypothetical protein [Streptomyces alkaliterrae]